MILFACQCGSPYTVEDQFAGGTLQCTACGKSIQIPAQSDPRVVLIYRAGESEDGVPMLREEVERLVAAGEFTETELIWDETTWRPVTDVMGGGVSAESAAKHKLQLKRKEDEEEAAEAENDSFGDIIPIQKVQLDEDELKQLPTQKRDRKAKKPKKEKKEKKPRGGKETGFRLMMQRAFGNDRSLGRGVNIPIQIFWFLVIVFVGYRMGVGPLVSKIREKPTYVVVYNHTPTPCVASLGWRRLKREIYPRTSACFEVYVGMKERQKLTLTPKSGGDKIKVKVPMWPGGLTVVNPGGLGTFAQWRLDAAKGEKLPSTEVKRLAEQISAHKEPVGLDKLIEAGREIAKKALVKPRKDVLFTSRQYKFDTAILSGDTQTIPKFVKELEERQSKSKTPLDLITCPPNRSIWFNGGSALYDMHNEKRVQMAIYLPTKTYEVGKWQKITVKSSPRLELFESDGALRLKMEIKDYDTRFEGRTYRGTWRYEAWCPKGKWGWQWYFEGSCQKPPKGKARVKYRYDSARAEHGPTFSN